MAGSKPKITLKKSSVASKVPLVGDLDYGELALNYTDGKLWYKDNANVIRAFSDSDTVASINHTHPTDDIVLLDSAITNNSAVLANTAKVTNASHTGDASGSTTLTLQPAAITGKTELGSGLASTDEILVSDAGTLKRMDISVFEPYFNSNLTFNSTVGTDSDITLAGPQVFDTVALTDGVITSASKRALTTSDIGAEPADATILKEADVDDTPVDGVTTAPVSSNWAFDHEGDNTAHGGPYNNYSHPNHTGHVTSTGDGATVLTIAAITGQTSLGSGLQGTDELIVNDGGVIKRMDISVMNAYFDANLDFQATGTYNTIIGTDSDVNTSGAEIIDAINVTDGVIQSATKRILTPGDIGAATSGHNHSGVYEPVDATILREADVDDTPVNGVTNAPVSSNWAFDHGADTNAHGGPYNNYSHPDHTGQVTSTNDSGTALTVSAITAQTELASGLASTDEMLVNDGGALKRMDVSVVQTYMQNNLNFTAGAVTSSINPPAPDSDILWFDTTTGQLKVYWYDSDTGQWVVPLAANSTTGGVDSASFGNLAFLDTVSGTEIDNNAVSLAKMADMATASFIGRNTGGTGDPEVLSATTARGILNVADNANNYSHPNHTGQVTSTGDGATVVTVSAITGQTELASGLAGTDELLVSDGGVIKRMDVSVMNAYFNSNLNFQASGTYNTIIGTDSDVNTSGDEIIDVINVTDGVITSASKRKLTASDIGAQAAGTYNTIIGTDSDINTAGAQIIDAINVTDGVIQSAVKRTLTIGDIGAQAAGTYNTIIGTDTDIDTVNAEVMDQINVTDGVITSMSKRTMTLSQLGYTGDTNANEYSHPNHTGQITSTGDGATVLTVSAITSQTELASGLAGTDELLVSDAGVIKRMDVSVMNAYFNSNLSFNNYSHPDHTGHVTSTGDGATVLTVSGITGQTELASGLASTDELLVNDGGAIKRMDVSVIETYMQDNLNFGAGGGIDSATANTIAENADVKLKAFSTSGTLTAREVCHYTSNGNMALADADDSATAVGLLGLTTAIASGGATIDFYMPGSEVIGFSGLTVGANLYLSTTPGDITETKPSGVGDIVRVVGYALDSDVIWWSPDNSWVEVKV